MEGVSVREIFTQLPASVQRQLNQLATVFSEENQKLNLSAHRTHEKIWQGNVMDSLAAFKWIASQCPSIPRPLPHEPSPHENRPYPRPFPHEDPSIPRPLPHENRPYPRPFPHGGNGGPLDTERYAKEKVPESLLSHAREMRKNPTPEEKALWKHLRHHQLHQHFRRQHPVGNSILDFYCHKYLLGIEVDGDIHEGREEWDLERSENLHGGYGIHILRFSNTDVLNNVEYVVKTIRDFIGNYSPPPVGEGLVVGEKEGGMCESKILDLGTGGGFPLLPLAIAFPQHHFTGLDSTRKKMDAVQRIVDHLKVPNVTLVTARAEELGKKHAHSEKYDIVTARAVAETAILLEYCAPFVKVGGHILLWKSIDIDDEISAASRAESQLHLRRNPSINYDLGGDWGKRQILVYEKIKTTPKEYPRSVGSAKRHPL
ncbi:hypothetical protein A3G69_04605 [Candidatus Peribacteria bacterium RIFCSPLOWO2_12_FULL_53_10]|nr:MAG: hypothetical protein A3G69_04605 [Candidatus Peribacteria bacterium RIFCSPLOWO2_12_FULL_53_10]